MFSGDFSHFIFSTQTKFTPDGLSTPPGSVYDNDISTATVEVISKDAAGNDIQVEPSKVGEPKRITGIAGVSPNGSHVLLAGHDQRHIRTRTSGSPGSSRSRRDSTCGCRSRK